ncbi:MAG TPA: hypothetical protein H9671_05600 [Firmicutes bacterium]|nr:hypothetical protein [Bacillota bacterium]
MDKATRRQRQHDRRMRRILYANCILFLGLLFVIGILSLILPKKTVSEYERRELAKRPDFSAQALFQGNYIRDLELYYADTFPFRDAFVEAGAWLKEHRGLEMDDGRLYGQPETSAPEEPVVSTDSSASVESSEVLPGVPVEGSQPESSQPEFSQPSESSSETSSAPPESSVPAVDPESEVVGEQNGPVFIVNGMALQIFGGTQRACDLYTDAINRYAEELGDSVQIYNMVVPTSTDFYMPEKYRSLTNSQKDNIDYIYSRLSPKVKSVDAYSVLAEHTDEYLFFNTDHHWTGLGAYYAYTAFAEAAGFEAKKLSDYETRRLPNPFLGTLYAQTQNSSLKNNPDYVDYYIVPGLESVQQYLKGSPYTSNGGLVWAEYATGANSYGVFLQGDYPLTTIQTNNHNGKRIVVVKESYGNAFAPFLIADYEEIFVVDLRYFELNLPDFIRENQVTDLLFLNNVFAANTALHINRIEAMRTQEYAEPVTAPADTESSSEDVEQETSSDEVSTEASSKEDDVSVLPEEEDAEQASGWEDMEIFPTG